MESFGVDDCGSVSRSIILLSEDEITKVKVKELVSIAKKVQVKAL